MKRNFIDFRKGALILTVIMGMAKLSSAQVAVGTTTPDPSAQFQIESTSKGLLIPRVTTTDAVTAPATGLLVYQTGGTAGFYYNSGTSVSPNWVRVSDAATALADGSVTDAKVATTAGIVYSKLALTNSIQNGDIVANAITTSKVANGTVTTSKIQDSAVSSLKILTNAVNNAHIANGTLLPAKLSASGATSGQVLGYDGTNISWTTPSNGTSLSTGSVAGQVYLTGAAGAVPTTPVSVSGDATLSGTGVLTFGTSGVAAGSYGIPGSPAPLFTVDGKGRITSAQNTTMNLTSAQFANQGTTTTVLHGNAAGVPSFSQITNSDISTSAAIAYSKLNLSGSVATTDLSTTGATTGQVLGYDGTNISWTTPSSTIADGLITNQQVSASAAIAYSKLNLANSVINTDITANAITTSKVADGTVTTSKMADSSISGSKILTNAVNNAHIADGTLFPAKLSTAGASTGQVLGYNGSNIAWTTPSASVSYGYAANTSESDILVNLGGTNIPLPDYQALSANVIVNGSNDAFTVATTGVYQIQYSINLASPLLTNSAIFVNGVAMQQTVISPSTSASTFNATAILTLAAGDIISLDLYGLIGIATLQSGLGASMNILKLQ